MQHTKLTGRCFALACVVLIAAGCGKTTPTATESAANTNPPSQESVEPGSAKAPARETESPAEEAEAPTKEAQAPAKENVAPAKETEAPAKEAKKTDNQVRHAVATVPAERVVPAQDEPARMPASDSQPLAESFDEPLPDLPLEEPINSGESMPQVYFTEAHAKTNVVGVGDAFPKLELKNLDGQPQNFGDLLGEKLTIVVFWNGKLPTALEELADMQSRFLDEFAEQGVAVVGVNVGDEPQLAKELVQQAGAKYPQLSDPDGGAFAKVATERMPRTYLIDTAGQILWFDIEYSRTTRQELLSALRFSLKAK